MNKTSSRGGSCVAASAGLAASGLASRRCAPRRRRAAEDHARTRRGRQEGRQGRLVHLDRPARSPRRSPRRSRPNIPASTCRSSAPAPSASSSASARSTRSNIHACRRRQLFGRRALLVWKRQGWLAPYVPADVAQYFPATHKDPDGFFATVARDLVAHRLQHQAGQARGRAQELRRPARSRNGWARSSRRIPAIAARS